MDTSKWALKYDTAAQDFLGADEQVLAAVQVARGGGWTMLAASQVSGVLAIGAMLRGKRRAGGLPQQFLLAVTAERIYALALPKMSSGLKPRAVRELARWDRRDARVSAKPLVVGTQIAIESPAEGERVECQGPGGELTDRFLRAAAGAELAAA